MKREKPIRLVESCMTPVGDDETCIKVRPCPDHGTKPEVLPALLNGKGLAHWEAMAKELVVDSLVRASLHCDSRSLPGKIAGARLMRLAQAEDGGSRLVRQVLETRTRFQQGAARALAAMTAPPIQPVGKPRKTDRGKCRHCGGKARECYPRHRVGRSCA